MDLRNNSSNGRINLSVNQYDMNVFQLYDRIPATRPTNFENALLGNQEVSQLSTRFFSADNINTLQLGIIEGVKKLSKNQYNVGYQNEDSLKTIMRSIYLQHSMNLIDKVKEQVNALNCMVLEYCVPKVYGEAQGYQRYLEDISTMATPLPLPVHPNKNDKTLELKPWF